MRVFYLPRWRQQRRPITGPRLILNLVKVGGAAIGKILCGYVTQFETLSCLPSYLLVIIVTLE